MALWDRVRDELDHAGRVVQDTLDEGRERLEAFRARQRADKVALSLGYAYFKARQDGREMEPEVYARLSSELAAADAEATRHETEADAAGKRRKEWM